MIRTAVSNECLPTVSTVSFIRSSFHSMKTDQSNRLFVGSAVVLYRRFPRRSVDQSGLLYWTYGDAVSDCHSATTGRHNSARFQVPFRSAGSFPFPLQSARCRVRIRQRRGEQLIMMMMMMMKTNEKSILNVYVDNVMFPILSIFRSPTITHFFPDSMAKLSPG